MKGATERIGCSLCFYPNKKMKIPKIKEDESLAMWRERLAREFNLDDKMQELIREVSITSYIQGTNTTIEILKKEGKL